MISGSVNDAGPRLRADARRNRDNILKAAKQHFASQGVSASLEEIARTAGVGAGTLYRHYPSRDALLVDALRDSQTELRAHMQHARDIADPDAALAAWLAGLQDYLRSFNGLPGPLLAAIKQDTSPLALSCEALVLTTGEFLARAQQHGHARASITANDLFLSALGIAWVLNRADTCGVAPQALNAIFAHGYREDGVTD